MSKTKTAEEIIGRLKKAGLTKHDLPDPKGELSKTINVTNRRALFGPDCEDEQLFSIAAGIRHLQLLREQNKSGALDETIRGEEAITAPALLEAAVQGKLSHVMKAYVGITNSRFKRRLRTTILLDAYMAAFRLERFPTAEEIADEMGRIIRERNGKGRATESINDPRTMRSMLNDYGLPFSVGKSGRPPEKRRRKTRK